MGYILTNSQQMLTFSKTIAVHKYYNHTDIL